MQVEFTDSLEQNGPASFAALGREVRPRGILFSDVIQWGYLFNSGIINCDMELVDFLVRPSILRELITALIEEEVANYEPVPDIDVGQRALYIIRNSSRVAEAILREPELVIQIFSALPEFDAIDPCPDSALVSRIATALSALTSSNLEKFLEIMVDNPSCAELLIPTVTVKESYDLCQTILRYYKDKPKGTSDDHKPFLLSGIIDNLLIYVNQNIVLGTIRSFVGEIMCIEDESPRGIGAMQGRPASLELQRSVHSLLKDVLEQVQKMPLASARICDGLATIVHNGTLIYMTQGAIRAETEGMHNWDIDSMYNDLMIVDECHLLYDLLFAACRSYIVLAVRAAVRRPIQTVAHIEQVAESLWESIHDLIPMLTNLIPDPSVEDSYRDDQESFDDGWYREPAETGMQDNEFFDQNSIQTDFNTDIWGAVRETSVPSVNTSFCAPQGDEDIWAMAFEDAMSGDDQSAHSDEEESTSYQGSSDSLPSVIPVPQGRNIYENAQLPDICDERVREARLGVDRPTKATSTLTRLLQFILQTIELGQHVEKTIESEVQLFEQEQPIGQSHLQFLGGSIFHRLGPIRDSEPRSVDIFETDTPMSETILPGVADYQSYQGNGRKEQILEILRSNCTGFLRKLFTICLSVPDASTIHCITAHILEAAVLPRKSSINLDISSISVHIDTSFMFTAALEQVGLPQLLELNYRQLLEASRAFTEVYRKSHFTWTPLQVSTRTPQLVSVARGSIECWLLNIGRIVFSLPQFQKSWSTAYDLYLQYTSAVTLSNSPQGSNTIEADFSGWMA